MSMGCGLACVAMAAGTTYSKLRAAIATDEVEPTQLHELREMMRQHGVALEGRLTPFRTRKPTDLPFDALLKANPRLAGKEWHWMIWDYRRRRVLDPKMPPYKRVKFVSYVELRRLAHERRESPHAELSPAW